jgi:diguanylate cyclase (GGDEF)-like protein
MIVPEIGRGADTGPELVESLRRITLEFLADLPTQWGEIQAAWARTRIAGGDAQVISDLRLKTHSLSGAAGSLGFLRIAERGRLCQRAFETVASSPSDAPAVELAGRRIDELGKAIMSDRQIDLAELARRLGAARAVSASLEEQRKRRMVFLVEDNSVQAKELSTQIGYFGYGVRVFDSPTELEEALPGQNPTVILMDITFPEGGLAGVESAQRLGAGGEGTAPVIFITMNDSMSFRLQAVRAGGKAYFVKPVDVDSLVDAMDKLAFRSDDKPARILIVDDSRVQATYTALQLKKASMTTEILSRPMDLIERIIGFEPDLVLMDMYMPDCTGIELATVIRQMERFVGLPIVFLSGETNKDKQLAALGIGGDDFLMKPIEPEHLISSVTTKVARYRQLRIHMIRDGLTGLFNHNTILEFLSREVERAREAGGELSVAMLDLDDFKDVNDSYGHATGDRVLKSLSHMLRQRLREHDIIGRYGGEEFAVIMPDTDEGTALAMLTELAEGFGMIKHLAAAREFTVTFSCGIAGLRAGGSADSLLEEADAAMYAAKGAGRNRVMLACP